MAVNIRNSNWTKANVIIQFIIGIGIIATFFAALITVCQQRHFHITSLRPWIDVEPSCEIAIISDSIHLSTAIYSYGQTPALNVKAGFIINSNDTFPPFRITGGTEGMISPNDTIWISKWIKLETKNDIPFKESDIRGIINANKLFLHIFVEYWDFADQKYLFKGTYQAKGLLGSSRIKRWTIIKEY